jgi:hypothetical protein
MIPCRTSRRASSYPSPCEARRAACRSKLDALQLEIRLQCSIKLSADRGGWDPHVGQGGGTRNDAFYKGARALPMHHADSNMPPKSFSALRSSSRVTLAGKTPNALPEIFAELRDAAPQLVRETSRVSALPLPRMEFARHYNDMSPGRIREFESYQARMAVGLFGGGSGRC